MVYVAVKVNIPPTAIVEVDEPAVLDVSEGPVKFNTPPFPSLNTSVTVIFVSGTLPVFSTLIVYVTTSPISF